MERSRVVLLSIMILVSIAGTVSRAEIPQIISYQGKVTDASGNPVADGNYTMRFRIYNVSSGGTALWDSGDRSIAVAGGVFSVLLGESPQPAITLAFDVDYWLLATFNGVDQSPRQRLASAGYAYMASGLVPGTEISGSVSSGTSSAIKGTNTATSGITYGVWGQTASTAGRGLFGVATATSGITCGVWGQSASTYGRGVYGIATDTSGSITYGGYFGSTSTAGRGVFSAATATSGETYGVEGMSSSTGGCGVYGYASATTGTTDGVHGKSASTGGNGVYGEATATTGSTYGVYGRTYSTSGEGVYGYASATTGTTLGVHGKSASTNGRGVVGEASSTIGLTYAVYGLSNSTEGYGVYGWVSATSGYTYGVYGSTSSTSGEGVYGYASATTGTTFGVHGKSASTNGRGVVGEASSTIGLTYAVYGLSNSIEGCGVYGWASASSGYTYGVSGSTSSTSGEGVYGYATATRGTTYGVHGKSASTSGAGLYGQAIATTGIADGVLGESVATNGCGVRGVAVSTTGLAHGVYGTTHSTQGSGVYGYAVATSGFTYGVQGFCASASGYGGFFEGRLRVDHSISSTANPDNHVGLIYNTSTSTSPDVLCLKVGYTGNPGSSINYITFLKGADVAVGAIEGDGAGGITLLSGGSDFAEYLPRRGGEGLEPGDVVGVFDGKVTKRTEGASQVMVVSTRPIVLGNSPGEDKEEGYARVAFIGQVKVKVRGVVKTGDLLIPSGMGDGVAVAVSREDISAEQFRQVFGQAWEGSGDEGVKQVHAAVGLLQHDPGVARLEAENRELRKMVEALQVSNAGLQERVAAIEESR